MLDRLGLRKTTLLDYPGLVAATVFTHGCPLRCPYCHNPELVAGPVPDHFLSRGEVLALLAARVGRIEGVCITGGEPLVHPDLGDLVARIADLGLRVKLDTCGMYPDRLKAVLDAGRVSLVALDIKTAPENYDRVGGDGDRLRDALTVLRQSDVPFVTRTTAAPGVVEQEDIEAIANLLRPGEQLQLTQFRSGVTLDPTYADRTPHTGDTLAIWSREIGKTGVQCAVRGTA